MKYSRILSAIMTGRWMIRPEDVIINQNIIEKFLNREYLNETSSLLSDKKSLRIYLVDSSTNAIIQTEATSSKYDELPNKSTAIFDICGTMLKYGTWCSYGTEEIADAIREAASHKNVNSIMLRIDSGGGSVDAISPLIEAIEYAQQVGKPVVSLVDLCASAAYYVAIHSDEIIANNSISSEIGSIGVMMGFKDYTEHYKKDGIKEHIVYSSHSDWKNLPYRKAIEEAPQGDDGSDQYEMIRTEMLDPLAVQFQNTVKEKRAAVDTSVDGILSGRMFYASDALKHGLIDGIGTFNTAMKKCNDLSIIYNYKSSKQ